MNILLVFLLLLQICNYALQSRACKMAHWRTKTVEIFPCEYRGPEIKVLSVKNKKIKVRPTVQLNMNVLRHVNKQRMLVWGLLCRIASDMLMNNVWYEDNCVKFPPKCKCLTCLYEDYYVEFAPKFKWITYRMRIIVQNFLRHVNE